MQSQGRAIAVKIRIEQKLKNLGRFIMADFLRKNKYSSPQIEIRSDIGGDVIVMSDSWRDDGDIGKDDILEW